MGHGDIARRGDMRRCFGAPDCCFSALVFGFLDTGLGPSMLASARGGSLAVMFEQRFHRTSPLWQQKASKKVPGA